MALPGLPVTPATLLPQRRRLPQAQALAVLPDPVLALFDPWVFAASCSASFKLFCICVVVGWLLRTNKIPNSTATVMSQVSFWVFIPCMIFRNVSVTLAAQPDTGLLATIAAVALMQIAVGAACGRLLSPLVDGSYPRHLRLFGWHPSEPAEPAKAIAASTALATGAPMLASSIVPKPRPAPQGMRQIVHLACTFGNSFTLPCVFFASLLPPPLFQRAIGYAGLFLLAWSPCLWTIGLRLVSAQEAADSAEPGIGQRGGGLQQFARAVRLWLAAVVNPPLAGCLAGLVVGLSPLGQALLAGSTPPMVATAGAAASAGGQALAGAASLPLELQLLRGATQAVLDVVKLLAEGTLATQTVVLAAALLQRQEGAQAEALAAGESPVATDGGSGMLATLRRLLLPADGVEARALAVLAAVRYVLVPVTTVLLLRALATPGGLLAKAASDPVLLFVLLVESVMPAAQNLVIMLQLSPVTRRTAPGFTRLLLKLYAFAVVPVTLWVTGFATSLEIPVVRQL